MTNLTDRYVAATVRELPREKRAEIDDELRESILDQVEARVADGQPRSEAEYEVLVGMGDPIRLAASYSGRQLALIGPSLYPAWRRLLVVLVSVITPIVAILAGVGSIVDKQSLGSVIGAVVGGAFMAAVQVIFWVTLVFAIMERTIPQAETSSDPDLQWTPKDLPAQASTKTKQGLGDMLGEVIGNAVLIALLVYQQWWLTIDGQQMSVINPEVRWWVPLMIVTLAASALLALWIGASRQIRRPHVGVDIVISLVAVVPTIYLALTDQLLNPAFVAQFSWLSDNLSTVNVLICLGFIVGWGMNVVDKGIKAYRSYQAGS